MTTSPANDPRMEALPMTEPTPDLDALTEKAAHLLANRINQNLDYGELVERMADAVAERLCRQFDFDALIASTAWEATKRAWR